MITSLAPGILPVKEGEYRGRQSADRAKAKGGHAVAIPSGSEESAFHPGAQGNADPSVAKATSG